MCGRMWTHTQAAGIDISGYREAHTGRWDVTQMQLTQADGAQRPGEADGGGSQAAADAPTAG